MRGSGKRGEGNKEKLIKKRKKLLFYATVSTLISERLVPDTSTSIPDKS